jgi:hypothetical protein
VRHYSSPLCRQRCSRPLSRPARSLRCNDRSRREAGSRAYGGNVCAVRPQYPNRASHGSHSWFILREKSPAPARLRATRGHRRTGAMTIPNTT